MLTKICRIHVLKKGKRICKFLDWVNIFISILFIRQPKFIDSAGLKYKLQKDVKTRYNKKMQWLPYQYGDFQREVQR